MLLFAGMPRSRPTAELDINEIHYKELTVTATTASSLRDCTEAARLLGSGLGDLGWMVTDRFALDDAEAAAARAQDRAALKVVITPGAHDLGAGMQPDIFKRFYWWEDACVAELEAAFGVRVERRSFRALAARAAAVAQQRVVEAARRTAPARCRSRG